MKSILIRVKRKILLWIRFFKISSNFWSVVWFRVVNMLKLEKLFPYHAKIVLKNGVVFDYGTVMDLSAVPVVVEIWEEKIYNPEGFEIGNADTVFDIGANVGNFSLFAAKHTSGQVFAFEPVKKNYDLLVNNIQLNQLTNVVPMQLAVAGTAGKVVMHVSAVDTAHSITHEAFSQEGDVEVEAVEIEAFCEKNNIPRIDFLKVDCEGAEYEIFEKISSDMLRRINKIGIEHHERFVHRDHAEISNRLKSAGFNVLELPDHFIFAK